MAEKTIFASIKCIPYSHYKLAPIADMVRNMGVKKAENQLLFCKKLGAYNLRKLLLSCVANAKHNFQIDAENLFIKELRVGKAMVLKRIIFRGKGRSSRIEKRYSNASITLQVVKS